LWKLEWAREGYTSRTTRYAKYQEKVYTMSAREADGIGIKCNKSEINSAFWGE